MSDAAFLDAIRTSPRDDTLRLVYADYLDDHGDPLAAVQRLAVALAAVLAAPDDDAPRLAFAQVCDDYAGRVEAELAAVTCEVPGYCSDGSGKCGSCYRLDALAPLAGLAARAEFIRCQCDIAGWGPCPGAPHGPPGSPPTPGCVCAERNAVREWERELLLKNSGWAALPGCDFTCPSHDARIKAGCASVDVGNSGRWVITCEFRRGFVESVTATSADWLAHADAIRAAQPVRKVRLTTEPMGDAWWIRLKPHVVKMGPAATVKLACEAEWPGIDFELPPALSGTGGTVMVGGQAFSFHSWHIGP